MREGEADSDLQDSVAVAVLVFFTYMALVSKSSLFCRIDLDVFSSFTITLIKFVILRPNSYCSIIFLASIVGCVCQKRQDGSCYCEIEGPWTFAHAFLSK